MKKHALRFLATALVLVMVLGMAPVAMAADEYKVWMPPFGTEDSFDKDFWETQLAPLAEEKGIEIVVEIVPWGGYEEKYLTGISSGAGPDVGYMYVEMINDFINMGALMPMDDYITAEDRENYIYLDNGVFQGQQYMFPIIVGNPRMVFCNMDILEKSGFDRAPQTWDEFIEYGLKIQEDSPDVYPFVQGWGDTNPGGMNTMFYPFLWQAGGEIFDEEGKLVLDSPAGVKAAQFLYDLRFTHNILPEVATSLKGADAENMFLEGKAAMITGSSSFAGSRIIPAGINWDFAILKDEKQATFVALDCLVIPSNTKDPDIAYEIVKFMTSGDVMTAFHTEISSYPPIGKDEEYHDVEEFKAVYEDETIEFNNYPAVAGMYKINDMLYKNIQMMLLDQMTPQEVMDSIVSYGETVLE